MHFDPVTSQGSPTVRSSPIASDAFIEPDIDRDEREEDRDDDVRSPRTREGLPPAFRMRHGRHYVEQLMGDAPLRTVKEIAVGDIEPPPDDPADLQDLEQSIRRLGILEPLLVSRHGDRYQIIAGMNRLRAARNAGLRAVPCLVHDVDEDMLRNMREASAHRVVPPPPEPAAVDVPRETPLPSAFAEVTAGLRFVSALLPAINAAGEDRFRWSILTDLAGVELLRARTVASVAEVLANDPVLNRTEVTSEALIAGILSAVSAEARLRGAKLDVQVPDPDYRLALDAGLVTAGITGLLQSLLALLPAGEPAIRVQVKGTTVRPALIVQVTQDEIDLGGESGSRFFDGDWRQHPAGAIGGLLLAGAARIARLHGGRADMQPLPGSKGCTLTFVIPKPLEG